MLDALRQDVMFGLRAMVRTPLTTGAAVVSLALGIGATTAMFGALDVWLLRPLPLPGSDRLVRVFMANRETGWTGNAFSTRDFADWREASRGVDLAAWRRSGASLATGERVERVGTLVASANLLRVLGLVPGLGRDFLADEERPGGPRAALLSDAFWRESFGGDAGVLGRTVILDGEPSTVVGILPPEAAFSPFRADVWLPLQVRLDEPRGNRSLWAVARLEEGASLAAARDLLGRVASRVADQDPASSFPDATVIPLRDSVYGPQFRQGGAVVGSAVLFVLLIACANIANLLLAKGARRSSELALRNALGAGRGRILRQLLTESGLLALAGGLAGVGVARLGQEGLLRWVLPRDMPGYGQLALDGRVLAIAVGLTALSTVLFGLLPALAGSRTDLRGALQDGGGGGHRPGGRRVGGALVTGEVALALVLLVSTGLLTRSLAALRETDLGFHTEGLLAFAVTPSPTEYAAAEDVRGFHRGLEERVRALPGVGAVAVASASPVGGYSSTIYEVPDDEGSPGEARRSTQLRWVGAGYPDVLEMRLLAGAWPGEEIHVPGGAPLAVASRALIERHWSSPEAALGRRIELDGGSWTVVGVAEDAHILGPAEPAPATLYLPMGQSESRTRTYVVAARGDAGELVAAIRLELRALDPTVALYGVATLADRVRASMGPQVAVRRILSTLGGIAIVLTLVGVYGVIAHMVGLRTREMGLRMAVGVHPPRCARSCWATPLASPDGGSSWAWARA